MYSVHAYHIVCECKTTGCGEFERRVNTHHYRVHILYSVGMQYKFSRLFLFRCFIFFPRFVFFFVHVLNTHTTRTQKCLYVYIYYKYFFIGVIHSVPRPAKSFET